MPESNHSSSAASWLIVALVIVACVWANLHNNSYVTFIQTWQHGIDHGLMSLFFWLMGYEIKREIVHGELSHPRQALMPMISAMGGMIVPALIFASLNFASPYRSGWCIPMATDIVFALSALSLAGGESRAGLRSFLLTLAVVDDVGAVLVIAGLYTAHLSWAFMSLSVALYAVLAVLRPKLQPWSFWLGAALAWLALWHSGIHPTIGGVAVGLLTPTHKGWLPHWLSPLVHFFVVPVFVLTHAGVNVSSLGGGGTLAWGVFAGLLIGKPLGIAGLAKLADQLNWARLPKGMRMVDLIGLGCLGGIGFTMSLFMSALSLPSLEAQTNAKGALLAASFFAAIAGMIAIQLGTLKTKRLISG